MKIKNILAIAAVVFGIAFILAMIISNDFYVWVMVRVYNILLYALIFISGWLLGYFGTKKVKK